MSTSASYEKLVSENQGSVYTNSIWFLLQSSAWHYTCCMHLSNSLDHFPHLFSLLRFDMWNQSSISFLSYIELVCCKSSTWNPKPFVRNSLRISQGQGWSQVWAFSEHLVMAKLPVWAVCDLCLALSGAVLAVTAQNCVSGSTSCQTETWGSACAVPWPSCISWVSEPRSKTFGFEQTTWQQPQSKLFAKKCRGRMQASLSTVLQQPHLLFSFPKEQLNRALTFPRNYLFNRWKRRGKITLPWDVEVSGVGIHTSFEMRRGSITQGIAAVSAECYVVPVQILLACTWWPGLKVTAWLLHEKVISEKQEEENRTDRKIVSELKASGFNQRY